MTDELANNLIEVWIGANKKQLTILFIQGLLQFEYYC
jgi:hypothetical protein